MYVTCVFQKFGLCYNIFPVYRLLTYNILYDEFTQSAFVIMQYFSFILKQTMITNIQKIVWLRRAQDFTIAIYADC